MTPDNSKPKPPLAPVESCWWEDDIDKYFNWKFYTDAEDRMHEAHRRDREDRATEARKPAPKSPRKPRRRKS